MGKCRVYSCKSHQKHQKRKKHLKFHKLPADPITRGAWIQILGISEEEEKCSNVRVCSLHFDEDDYNFGILGKKNSLKRTTLPKNNLPEDLQVKLEEVVKVLKNDKIDTDIVISPNLPKNQMMEISEMNPLCEEQFFPKVDIFVKKEMESTLYEMEDYPELPLEGKLMVDTATQTEFGTTNGPIIAFERLNTKQILYFTDFSLEQFNTLYNFLTKNKSFPHETVTKLTTSFSAINQLLLTLFKYKLNPDFKMLAILFSISSQLAIRIFKQWTAIINSCLHDIDFWGLAKTDGTKYRVCLHCINVPTQVPEQEDCSDGEDVEIVDISKTRYKCLVGVNEGGIVIFCSQLFDSKLTNRQVFISSNILQMLSKGDIILTNEDFEITDILTNKEIQLNIIPFIINFESTFTKVLISAKHLLKRKIHSDRLVALSSTYKILSEPITDKELPPLFSSIIYNCAMLGNFKPKKS